MLTLYNILYHLDLENTLFDGIEQYKLYSYLKKIFLYLKKSIKLWQRYAHK